MLLSLHAVTGAVIGIAVHQPLLSAPIAFATHVLLDATPHWNFPVPQKRTLRGFWVSFGPDMVGTILVTGLLMFWFSEVWLSVLWGVCWASLPDFLTLFEKQDPWARILRAFYTLHERAQWEVSRGPGLAIQGFYLAILVFVLISLK